MFKITVIETKSEVFNRREYQKISDTGNKEDNGIKYGYVNSEVTEDVETTLLEQNIEDIDLPAIIKAVNKI